jgi:hypothetical protein
MGNITSTVAVQIPALSDADLQRNVCDALANDPATDDYQEQSTVLLKVRIKRFIPDFNVTRSMEQALARDPYVGFFNFSVYVRNGKASLYGQVGSQFEQ